MAIAGRFVPLLLTRSWLGQEDHGLENALREELPGILNWALDGLARLARAGAVHAAARRRRGDGGAPGPRVAGRRVRARPLRPRPELEVAVDDAVRGLAGVGGGQRPRPLARSRCSAATCAPPSPGCGSPRPADDESPSANASTRASGYRSASDCTPPPPQCARPRTLRTQQSSRSRARTRISLNHAMRPQRPRCRRLSI